MQRVERRRRANSALIGAAGLFLVGGVLTGILVMGFGFAGVILGAVLGLAFAWLVIELASEETWRRPPRRYSDGVPYDRSASDEENEREVLRFRDEDEAEGREDLARLEAKRRSEVDHSSLKGPPPSVPFP